MGKTRPGQSSSRFAKAAVTRLLAKRSRVQVFLLLPKLGSRRVVLLSATDDSAFFIGARAEHAIEWSEATSVPKAGPESDPDDSDGKADP